MRLVSVVHLVRPLTALVAASLVVPMAPPAIVHAASTTVTATKDAHIRSGYPTRNYGTVDVLRVRESKDAYRAYLAFDVPALERPLVSATLRLLVTDSSPDGGTVASTSANWTELGITWSNAPAPSESLGALGRVTADTWVTIDVTDAIQGPGPVAFAIASGNGNSAFYASRESATSPELVLVFEDPPPAPPVASFTASASDGTAPLAVTFTDTSTGAPTSWAWDFEDDGTVDSTAQNPSFTYTDPGSYSVRLTVTNDGGSDTTVGTPITVVSPPPPAPPVASFTASASDGTAPLAVTFTDTSTGAPTSWAWDFEDDGTVDSTAQNPSFTYTDPGSYSVRLTVTNDGGSDTTVGTPITVVSPPPPAPPVASFTASASDGTAPLAVTFTDTSTGAPTSWAWDFEDDGTVDSTAQNPSFTYTDPGSYSVRLTVTNDGGSDTLVADAYVTVEPPPAPPVADFTAAVRSGEAPLAARFTDTSTGAPTSWAWDFEDDGTVDSTAQNPSFTYTDPGSYSVRLTVTNDGGSDTISKSAYITVSPPSGSGTFAFPASADAKVRGLYPDRNYGGASDLRARTYATDPYETFVKFDVADLSGPVTRAVLRMWVTDASPDSGSVFAVSSDWTELGITLNNAPSIPATPVAAGTSTDSLVWYEWDVTSAVTGNGPVSFAITSASGNSVLWASRETSDGPQLIVETGGGAQVPPGADFTAAPVTGIAPLFVSFLDASTGGATAWAWDFDADGTVDSTSPDPSYTYADPGTYTVSLTVTSPNGTDTETKTDLVVVDAPPTPGPGDQVLVGAGDIASCSSSGDEATAALIDDISGTVFTTGDNVYSNGTPAEFQDCYEPSWGRFKARTLPSVGNHEYATTGATGYFDYFGAAAGDPDKGYYSYDLGAWHVVVLNSNCSKVGGCGAGSPQEQWLRADLASSGSACTVAYFHHPRFSSATITGTTSVTPLWQALYDAGTELVLNGHAHVYERFAPMDPDGNLDLAAGIRQITIGTGGTGLHAWGTIKANSEVRSNGAYGVLKLVLRSGSYSWQFVPVAGANFSDTGSATCH